MAKTFPLSDTSRPSSFKYSSFDCLIIPEGASKHIYYISNVTENGSLYKEKTIKMLPSGDNAIPAELTEEEDFTDLFIAAME